MSQPKILFFDIESAGVNALRSDLGIVIVFGYKWSHEAKAHVLTISKNGLRNFDDKTLLKRAAIIFEQADLVVAHYGAIFDRRFIQGRLLINNLPPIPATKMRDTCLIARSVANFSSNRLKHLCKILNLRHQKLDNNWPNAWFEVMRGNMRVLHDMGEYCKGDVLAVEDLYYRLRSFDNAHPRMIEDRSACSVCGGKVVYRGFAYNKHLKYRRYICYACRRWGTDRRSVK